MNSEHKHENYEDFSESPKMPFIRSFSSSQLSESQSHIDFGFSSSSGLSFESSSPLLPLSSGLAGGEGVDGVDGGEGVDGVEGLEGVAGVIGSVPLSGRSSGVSKAGAS